MVRDSKGTPPDNTLRGDGWGWSWFDTDKPLKTTSTDYHDPRRANQHVPVIVAGLQQQSEVCGKQPSHDAFRSGQRIDAVATPAKRLRHRLDRRSNISNIAEKTNIQADAATAPTAFASRVFDKPTCGALQSIPIATLLADRTDLPIAAYRQH
ncbi:hypothetical protein OZ411_42140 [Bradyrhizobium sp. Arg237L]|uniref:hypothetical protein n=1 Tax=Bradyrhizobium sp. Arg237L TaxID=3003352 RepID=UPI00249DD09B|nr:hypothetical protein [Bradyrhizobium sp. Arg237L]MDI4239394.1 hypothetical protein [Bradyrhizobium sp. Arg237L]